MSEGDAKAVVQHALKVTGMSLDQLASALDYKSLKRAMSGEIPLPDSKRKHIQDLVTIAELRRRPPTFILDNADNDSAPPFSVRLKAWRERNGYDEAIAAKILGVGLSKYKEHEQGRKPSPALTMKLREIEHESSRVAETHLADKYERIREQERDGNGISTRPAGEGRAMMMRVVPVLGWAKAGEAVEFEDVVDWDERVSLPVNDAKAFGIRVRGDSMSPRICEGDIVVVSPSEPPRNEKPVVVRLRDQGILLKQFHRLTAVTFELRSLNPFYLPVAAAMTDVVWIYPVIATINYP